MTLRRVSIRSSLFWLMAACLLPAIVMSAGFVYHGYLEGRRQQVRDSAATVRALLSAVDSEFAGAELSMYTLSSSLSLKNHDYTAFYAEAKEVLRHSRAHNIVLIDAAGQQIVNTAVPLGNPLLRVNNETQLRYVLASGKSNVSGMFTGPVLQRQVVNVAVPVKIGNTVTHSLVAVFLPEQIQELLVRQRFPEERIVAIFDDSSSIVALTGDVAHFRGKRVNPGLAEALQNADEGALETVNRLGVQVVTNFMRSPTTRWGVAIGIPRATLAHDLSSSLMLIAGLGCLLLLLGTGLAYRISGRITQAFRDLTLPARELGYGNAVVVPELPIEEAVEVGQALERASVMLAAAHESMRSGEARMRAIVESASDAVVIVDDSWCIVLFNLAAVQMFDCPREAAIGTSFLRFVPERLRDEFSAKLQSGMAPGLEVSAAGNSGVEVSTGMRSTGEEFPVEQSFPRAIDGDSRVRTLVLRDITARLRIQNALEQSNLDLQQFAFVASHDLRTPLRSIGGFLQILKKNHAAVLDEHASMLVQRTLDATSRLAQLTDDLLSYARVGSEVKPLVLVACNEAAAEALALLHGAITDTAAQVSIGELPEVMGDRTQLVQLFMNLVGNGIKYCRGHAPVIQVSARPKGHDWVFSVADNGIGIDPAHHERIFEVFKRLHNQGDYPGTGIGLAVCRRVVERHGGTIWVASEPGKGSTFFFKIPQIDFGGDNHDTATPG